ncbi:MAG: hypothetical protein EA402_07545, partial [Planctomycetota bacterium]
MSDRPATDPNLVDPQFSDPAQIPPTETPTHQVAALHPLPRGLRWLHRLPSMAVALADQAVVSGANFLHMIAAAKCLSMEDFGVFSLAWAVLLFAGNIHHALVLSPLAVLYSEYTPAVARRYLGLLQRFHIGIMLLLFPALLAAWVLPTLGPLILATALVSLLRQATEHERRIGYVLHDSARALLVDMVTYGPLLVTMLWLWLNPLPLDRELVMVAAAIPAALGWMVGRRLFAHVRTLTYNLDRSPRHLKQHWAFGKWVLVTVLAMYAGSNAYPFLVAGIIGLKEVAMLNAAKALVGITHPIMVGLEAYFLPRLRYVYVTCGFRVGLKYGLRICIGMFLALLPILLSFVIWPEKLLSLVVSEEYSSAGWILRWFAVLYIIVMLNKGLSLILNAAKEPRAAAIGNILATGFTLVIGVLLVF